MTVTSPPDRDERPAVRVVRLLQATYPSHEHYERDRANWQLPANGVRAFGGTVTYSTATLLAESIETGTVEQTDFPTRDETTTELETAAIEATSAIGDVWEALAADGLFPDSGTTDDLVADVRDLSHRVLVARRDVSSIIDRVERGATTADTLNALGSLLRQL